MGLEELEFVGRKRRLISSLKGRSDFPQSEEIVPSPEYFSFQEALGENRCEYAVNATLDEVDRVIQPLETLESLMASGAATIPADMETVHQDSSIRFHPSLFETNEILIDRRFVAATHTPDRVVISPAPLESASPISKPSSSPTERPYTQDGAIALAGMMSQMRSAISLPLSLPTTLSSPISEPKLSI